MGGGAEYHVHVAEVVGVHEAHEAGEGEHVGRDVVGHELRYVIPEWRHDLGRDGAVLDPRRESRHVGLLGRRQKPVPQIERHLSSSSLLLRQLKFHF